MPFHVSASVLSVPDPCEVPTATQKFPVAHDTFARYAEPEGGIGLGTIDHAVPFQCSMTDELGTVESSEPTAMHSVVVLQEIALSPL